MEKAAGNHYTIFPRKSGQFTDVKENESVKSHNCLLPKVTWYFKRKLLLLCCIYKNTFFLVTSFALTIGNVILMSWKLFPTIYLLFINLINS